MGISILEEAQAIVNKSEYKYSRYDRKLNKEIDVVKRVTTTQIRKFLAEVVRISNMIEVLKAQGGTELTDDIRLAIEFLDVKLMYQVGRDDKDKLIERFYKAGEFSKRIRNAKQSIEAYESFAKLVEAIVAIFKFKGEK